MDISFSKKRIVVLKENRQVGYLKFSYPNDFSGKRNVVIDYLYVHPKYRRNGLATKMILFFLKHQKNITWVSLWTGRQMELDRSYSLYKKLGFKQIAYQADYYEKGIGTRLFAKRLDIKSHD